jgi:hypothetical protein
MRLAACTAAFAALFVLGPGTPVRGQEGGEKPAFPPEQIEQLVAPIALYPDDLVSQVLMASTYPLDVVQAGRWVKANPSLKGDAAAKAIEKKEWDASVKSLVNFPNVLAMMDGKLDWTQNLGNAFLAQQKDVMDAIQRLRKRAMDEGNLKASKEQNVTTEGETIVIVSTDPDVIYVPVYNPTVVYGTWSYPSYPPYYYYPPSYRPGPVYGFGAGIALGFAWGYAWGHCNWNSYDVNVDIDRNVNRNNNINRDNYRNQMQNRGMTGGKGAWQHDAAHRGGVGYGDAKTAQKFNRGASPNAGSRDAYRGRTPSGSGASRAPAPSTRPATGQKPRTRQPSAQPNRSSAFGGYTSGSSARAQSSRGQSSRQSYSRSTGRSGGGSRGGGRR